MDVYKVHGSVGYLRRCTLIHITKSLDMLGRQCCTLPALSGYFAFLKYSMS